MNTAALPDLRRELTPPPDRIRALPVYRGYPVPWFVAWVDGEPEFRTAAADKWDRAVREKCCWVCGQKLGGYLAFVLGPMCGITRTTSEPACHRECAEWSARNCPFLVRPSMVRRDHDLPEGTVDAPGLPLDRNPGVALVWITRGFSLFRDHQGRYLIQVGDPLETAWFAEGRAATRAEVAWSIEGGLPSLMEIAQQESPAAVADLEQRVRAFEVHLPPPENL